MLEKRPMDLLIYLRAIDPETGPTFPQHVYFSRKDYAILRYNLEKTIKKEGLRRSKLGLMNAVEYELLKHGPDRSFQDAIKTGYALIDEEKIKVAIVTAKLMS
jgi:hypothetical protein